MRHKVSQKRAGGKSEYPSVDTRGQLVIGVIFYIPINESFSIERLKKKLGKASGKLSWNEPVIYRSDKDSKISVFFPVMFHDEELELASHGKSKANFLQKLERISIESESIEKKLTNIIRRLEGQKKTVWYIAETHNTLT